MKQQVTAMTTSLSSRADASERPGLLLGWPTAYDERSEPTHGDRPKIKTLGSRQNLRNAIRYKGDGHLVTFAPTGAGKGAGVIIPNLLYYRGSTIVVDPKGENFAVTARYRQSLGHKVVLLDPFASVPDAILDEYGVQRGHLNPLDICSLTGTVIENDAQMIAESLAIKNSSESPFWDLQGMKLLAGIIAMEMEEAVKEKRPASFKNIIKTLFADDPVYALAVRLDTRRYSSFVTRSVAGGFLGITDKTRDGVLVTAQSYLSILISDNLLPFIDRSTISIRDIQVNPGYTLYIVIPPTKLDSHSALLKIWIATLLYAIMERTATPDLPTLFMLDECANLGELELLRKAVTLLRGYGLQVWMFFQDLAQMETLYVGDSKTMINNCGVMQTFGMARRSAAEPLSRVIGTYGTSYLQRMDKNHQVLSVAPGKTSVARLMRYYADGAFVGRYEQNPLIHAQPGRRKGAISRLIDGGLVN
jgi:type IV secretion system protein VirD4